MQFSLFITSAFGAGLTNTGFLVAIAILACILGAEVAGICILISKMLRARRARLDRDHAGREDGENTSYRNYAAGAIFLFGAIPQASYIALTVLAALAAFAAVLFVVLLIIFRVRGYDFAASDWYREAQARDRKPVADKPEEENQNEAPVYVTAEEALPDESEEQRQEAYTEIDETPEEEPFAAFAEEEQIDEAAECDGNADEILAAESEEPQVGMTPVEPAVTTTTVTEVREEPTFADGSQPYKVVEKVVTETVKEVYTETPNNAQTQNASSTNDAVLEKLVDLLDYEIRGRREAEKSEKSEAVENEKKQGSVATFAKTELPADEDEDDEDETDDDDELDADEADELKKGEDDDRDDEENDTDGDHFTGNERIIGFDEETGCYIVAHYRKSFEAKLIQSRPNIKKYYSDLKNALLSYKGTKSRISWTADSFHNGRTQIAKINVKTRILELYLALDPATLEGTVYRGKDVGSKKKYADTPFQYKLRTPRKFKWAMELLQRVCEEHGLSPIDIEHVAYDEQYPFDTTDNLVARKLIKEYIREEKPATSFELAPDHVPTVPDEDDSVIPANANFSWEFDNERMTEQEEPEAVAEEPAPAPEPEPVPASEPVPEPAPAPAPQASITRETVKVTEMRYTERYYNDTKPTYEQVITTTEPIEAVAVPADEPMEAASEAPAEEPEILTVDMKEPVIELDGESEATAEETEEDTEPDETVAAVAMTEEVDAIDNEQNGEIDEERFFDDEPYAEATEEEPEAEEPLEEEASTEKENNALPFRPSYYANRNYYEDSDSADETEEAKETAEVFDENYEEETVYEEETEYTEEPAAYEGETEYVSEAEPVPEDYVEPPKPAVNINPSVAVVDICSLEEQFPVGTVINLELLKAHDIVLPSATVLKIYAGGTLSKAFTVEANHFTLDAIKAISDAEGDSVMVR